VFVVGQKKRDRVINKTRGNTSAAPQPNQSTTVKTKADC